MTFPDGCRLVRYGEKPSPDEFEGDWGYHTGDWRINPHLHPNGLLDISEGISAAGKRFVLWIEPERIHQYNTDSERTP